jgi:hypothetical protein
MVPMVDPFEAPAGEAAPEPEADHDTDSDAGAEAPVEAETDEVVEAEDGAEDDRQG